MLIQDRSQLFLVVDSSHPLREVLQHLSGIVSAAEEGAIDAFRASPQLRCGDPRQQEAKACAQRHGQCRLRMKHS